MLFDKLQNRWVINEENATEIEKTVKNTALDIQTSHTSTRQWAKVELASHTSMLTVYQPCFYFLWFDFKPFFLSQESYKQKCRPVTPLAPNRNETKKTNKKKQKKPVKGLTSGYIRRSIHVICFTKLEELRHRMNNDKKSGLHMYMISTDNGFPSFLQII